MMLRKAAALGVACALTAGALAGCSTPSSSSSSTAATSTKDSPAETPGTAAPGADPAFTATAPVARPTTSALPARVAPSASADKIAAGSSVSYPGGVTVKVTSVKIGKTTSVGPGAFTGLPRDDIAIEIDDATGSDLDIGPVVVTMGYGSPELQARAVYEDGAADISGPVKAGGSVSGLYMFSVPSDQQGHAHLVVDFDALHEPAAFVGPLG